MSTATTSWFGNKYSVSASLICSSLQGSSPHLPMSLSSARKRALFSRCVKLCELNRWRVAISESTDIHRAFRNLWGLIIFLRPSAGGSLLIVGNLVNLSLVAMYRYAERCSRINGGVIIRPGARSPLSWMASEGTRHDALLEEAAPRRLLVGALLGMLVLYIAFRHWRFRSKYDWHRVPGPPMYPLVGHLPYYLSWDKPKVHVSLLKWAKKYGNVIKVSIFGPEHGRPCAVENCAEKPANNNVKKRTNFVLKPWNLIKPRLYESGLFLILLLHRKRAEKTEHTRLKLCCLDH